MSTSTLKKLQDQQTALQRKIEAEKRKVHAKIGGDLVRALGDENALRLSEFLAKLAKQKDADEMVAALMESASQVRKNGARNEAEKPARNGASAP